MPKFFVGIVAICIADVVSAAEESAHVVAAKSVIEKIENIILFPIMTLMMAVALLVFLWGAYEFVANAEDDTARSEGKSHMLFGIIGLLIMISAMGILKIAAGTFGIDVTF